MADGAKDKNYNLVTFLQESLQNVWTLDQYAQDAQGDQELTDLFQKAQQENQNGADQAKKLLAQRLQEEG
jgi:hypothetical protein